MARILAHYVQFLYHIFLAISFFKDGVDRFWLLFYPYFLQDTMAGHLHI